MDQLLSYLFILSLAIAAIIFLFVCIFQDCDVQTYYFSRFGEGFNTGFNDKVIWITGASSGIGEAIAKELVQSCNTVKIVLSARREEELDRVKAQCLGTFLISYKDDYGDNFVGLGGKRSEDSILVLPFDMTDTPKHEPALKSVLDTYGKLDIIVCNAGRSQRAMWHETDLAVDKELFSLNVFSLINLSRACCRYFKQMQKGHFVVMSSVAGKIGAHNSGSYAGSKFALHGYFESLRNEIGSKANIDITLICPGPVFTEILRDAFTGRSGVNVGLEYDPKDRRMTAKRCAYLSLVGIANRLNECWCAPFPMVLFLYIASYQPYLFSKISKFVYSRNLHSRVRGKVREKEELHTSQD